MTMETVRLAVDGLSIAGELYLPGGAGSYPTVCVFHGIPARPADPADRGYPLLAEKISGEGFAVLIFNFRGSGRSSGNFDIMGWTRDLGAALDYLVALPEVDRSRLALVGFSAGAAVSIFVASRDRRVSAVAACSSPAEFGLFTRDNGAALISRFRDIGIVRDEGFPPSVDEWLGGFRLVRPLSHISRISPRPLLVVHGSQDDMVDVGQARMLYEVAREPKRLAIIDGAGHRLRQDDRAMATVISWLKFHIGRQS